MGEVPVTRCQFVFLIDFTIKVRIHTSDVTGKQQDIIWHEIGTLRVDYLFVSLKVAFKTKILF